MPQGPEFIRCDYPSPLPEGECADFFLIDLKQGGSHVNRPESAYA